MVDPELLKLLVCPVPGCHQALDDTVEGLRCRGCGALYSTSAGWPNLIPEEARGPAPASDAPDRTGK